MTSKLESDLQDTGDWGKKLLVDFNTGKIQLISFNWSNKNVAIDVKMDEFILEKESYFKMWGLSFYFKLAWGSYTFYIC